MKNNKAISLVEIMITIALLGVISIPLYYVLEESNKRANLTIARDNIKQEANKVLSLLENDMTQARKGSYKEEGNNYTIKVRVSDKKEEELMYSFDKPKLLRYLPKKNHKAPLLVSNKVDKFEVNESLNSTGTMVISLVMKSDLPGIKQDEQPTYEQEKIIVRMEDATDKNDPHWREVGDVDKFFNTEGNLLAGLKEDATKIVQDFAGEWADTMGDVSNMTIDKLMDVKNDLLANLKEAKQNLTDINQQIKDLDWEALYDRSGLIGGLFGANKRKRNSANKIKDLVSGWKTKEEMSWQKVKNTARSDMKEEAIKAMYDAKAQLFDGQAQLEENLKTIENLIGSETKKITTEENPKRF